MNKQHDLEIFFDQKTNEAEYFKDYFSNIKNINELDTSNFSEHSSQISTDWIYIYQDRIVFDWLVTNKACFLDSSRLLDVGSRLSSVLFFAKFIDTTYLEPRIAGSEDGGSLFFPRLNITFLPGEAQRIPVADKSFDIVTSLHAIEHFGLGRYGDNIDYFGDQKGFKEFNRVLIDKGKLFISVPVNKDPTIQFNGQRIYSPEIINDMLKEAGFEILTYVFILSLGTLRSADGSIIEPITRDINELNCLSIDQQAAYVVLAQKI